MGPCNAPGAIQRLMEIVLTGLTYDIVNGLYSFKEPDGLVLGGWKN